MRDRAVIVVWLVVLVAAITVIAHARFVADLSAFLPTRPTEEQALLIDQLREGPASHLILIAIDGQGAKVADATLAALSRATAARMRSDQGFLSVNNGESVTGTRDREFFFNHRYLLSDRVSTQRFTAAGLHEALGESLDLLASSAGLMLQPLITRDPTAELVYIVESLTSGRDLPTVEGVWLMRSKEQGPHALLVAESRAAGSDIDGQQAAIEALRAAFEAARGEVGPTAAGARLVLSGPPVFAVDARKTIEHDAKRLSIIGALLVALLLGVVYRSLRALALGLLPMITGALCGIAIVAAGYGVVHGIALGFGVTLIGEAVDYGIYLFVQGPRTASAQDRGFWSTIALGVATSTIGFAALMFSGFPGLQQIGLLSIAGLVVAATVTRFVVPVLMPEGFKVRAMPTLGRFISILAANAPRLRWIFVALAIASVVALVLHRDALWSRELSSLSPVSMDLQETDGRLRSELGAPDVRDVVVIRTPDQESALRNSERVVEALTPLIADGTLIGFEAPSRYLPSQATQHARQAALPESDTLRRDFTQALDGLPFVKTGFDAFFTDVEREKRGPLLTRADLDGTSLGPAIRALLTPPSTDPANTSKRWTAVVALRSPTTASPSEADEASRRARIAAAVAPISAKADARAEQIRAIDIGAETQGLYAGYLSEALHLAGLGALAIVVLLAAFLRDASRLLRVIAPLAIAVVLVAAAHVVIEGPLTLFHFIGLLLIVAVGSNYTLFFDRRAQVDAGAGVAGGHALLVSLVVANLTSAIGFGVLGLSSLPVLHAIGTTVAPGALLALICAAVFAAATPVERVA